jgi:precorrin-4 methylase
MLVNVRSERSFRPAAVALLALLAVLAFGAAAAAAPPTALLTSIADWILTTRVRTNNVTRTADHLKTSIFINGNLARVLLAAHKIDKTRTDYLEEGKRLAGCPPPPAFFLFYYYY